MSSTGVIAHSIFGRHVWFAGPLAISGAAGGSQDYYKRTEDLTDWSGSFLPLPLSKTGLTYISAVHKAVFFMFSGGAASVVSMDTGITWDECNVDLGMEDVQWNGRYYFCGTRRSQDGITWEAIPNLAGTPDYTRARNSDGLLICGYSLAPTSFFEYSYDDGTTWTTVNLALLWEDEALFSLTLSNRNNRIHYSIGTPGEVTISNRYTDDLFTTDLFYAVSTQGLYYGKYGCSHLIQREYSDVLVLSKDGGWTSAEVVSATVDPAQHWLDYGNNEWAFVNRDALGTPGTYTIKYSVDGGDTWVNGTTLYGNSINIAYVGRPGNCAVYPRPEYTAVTEVELYDGTPDALVFLAQRGWGGAAPTVSADKEYIMANTNTDGTLVLYKKSANGFGYDIITDQLPTTQDADLDAFSISYDNQYFAGARTSAAGNGIFIYRQVGGVFTQLTISGANAGNQQTVHWHPSQYLLGMNHATSSVVQFHRVSGDTVTGPFSSPSLANTPRRFMSFSPDGTEVVVCTTGNRVKVLDISDPETAVTEAGTINGTASNSGNCGVYFTADGAGIITVSQDGEAAANIHYFAWNSGTGVLSAPVLIGTSSYRVQSSSMTQDGRYLLLGKDLNANYLEVIHLSADGTSILDQYTPTLRAGGTSAKVKWMGV